MAHVTNTKGLPEEYIKLVQEFADFLRQKTLRPVKGKEQIGFHVWPLGVKGKLTREEIYDHL
ncbi:MAG: hypothetical protein SRB2_02566 [Desulfobacteraceae bacterium Eth-SRB2]|nr:MAG: hypothetical protein SRB2_02566 [Desulfobacteraceae bacterium Eth-SRB2]